MLQVCLRKNQTSYEKELYGDHTSSPIEMEDSVFARGREKQGWNHIPSDESFFLSMVLLHFKLYILIDPAWKPKRLCC